MRLPAGRQARKLALLLKLPEVGGADLWALRWLNVSIGICSEVKNTVKIVIFMKNWVGDTFFQLPAIRLIKEKYPQAQITCIAPPRCRDLLMASEDVAEVLEFDEKSTHRSWLKRLAFVSDLRRKGPWAQGYLFHRSKTRAMLLTWAGVKERFGYGNGRGMWLTKAVDEPSQDLHHVDFFLELLRGCGFEIPKNPFYELPVSESATEKATQLLKEKGLAGSHFICFHLGANWEPKRWPPEHFAALADLIHNEWKMPVMVTGSANDRALFEWMQPAVKQARVVSAIGETTLDTLSALYAQAACVVSGDSGPLHIAAAVGAPTMALFGPTNPALTGPRGKRDCEVLSFVPEGFSAPFFGDAEIAKTWLTNISPEKVFQSIQKKGWLQ